MRYIVFLLMGICLFSNVSYAKFSILEQTRLACSSVALTKTNTDMMAAMAELVTAGREMIKGPHEYKEGKTIQPYKVGDIAREIKGSDMLWNTFFTKTKEYYEGYKYKKNSNPSWTINAHKFKYVVKYCMDVVVTLRKKGIELIDLEE